ncbi:MAG: hypothetical protein KIT48_21530 [Pseudolabrys sp.]|nr:hypothetical protein [Pseudolabrys sp.]
MPRAQIATHQAKYTLEQLHAELAGKILDNKAEAERLRQSMVHVEAVLKLIDPAYDVRPIAIRRRKPNPWFKRGTVWRAVMDVLRQAQGPLTATEVTARMLARKGVTDAAPEAVRELEGAVRAALQKRAGDDVTSDNSRPARWALVNT